jgi:cytochrome c biogenesis protein CcmG, thiol:disulfide interchange protein DsbE
MNKDTEMRKGRQRRNHLFRLLLLLLALLASTPCAEAQLRIGSRLPPITFTGVDGTQYRIPESLKGNVVILHFWQIGCSSCKLEIPAMDVLYKQYQRKGLEILAVNVGQKKEDVRSFSGELGVSYPLLIDPDEKGARLFGVADIPRTYVIDRTGMVRYRIFGGTSPEMLKKLILSLL